MIPHDYILELTQRSDVVDVVQSYVQLRKRGKTYTGLCPFHNEKTPSFVVYPETQSFYCFGCGAGGSTINFIMRYKNLEYIEAVKELAQRCGMPAPDEEDAVGKRRSRILAVNKDAARFFFNSLNAPQGAAARAYWRGRRLSDATIRRFGLGYAPDDFHALRDYLRSLHYTDEEMLDAGVIKRSEKGNLYDVFRNRVMVPIFDLRGNVVAFGGRVMTDEKPKYINSPETLAYKKSRTVFAMNLAKKNKDKKFILCEGYMDTIAMHQAGFDTAVACCGTALTAEQVKQISEYTDEVVLCYDSDEAGQKATARAMELFAPAQVKITVLRIPDAKDPDEYIKKYGAEQFAALIEGSANILEFRLQQIRAKYDIASADGRVSYIRDAITLLSDGRVTPTQRDVYAGRIAEETDVEKQSVMRQLSAAVTSRRRRETKQRQRAVLQQSLTPQLNVPYTQGGQKAQGVISSEQTLIAAVLHNPDVLPYIRQQLAPEAFVHEDLRAIYEQFLQLWPQKQYFELSLLLSGLPAEAAKILNRLAAQYYDTNITQEDVEMHLRKIRDAQSAMADRSQATAQDLLQMVAQRQRSCGVEPEPENEE